MERDTWQLEVIADPQSDVKIERPLSKELGTALDWQGLMRLAEKHAVRYMKAMTCLNVDRVFGMGLWEGVPLREVIWLTRPHGQPPPRLVPRLSTATRPNRGRASRVRCPSTACWKTRPANSPSSWPTR